jgi:hypothetical protein
MDAPVQGQVTLYDGAGNAVVKHLPAVPLTTEEARMLREFRKFLLRAGLQINVRCAKCATDRNGRPGYLDWTIGPEKVIFMCGCRQIVYLGQTL